MMVDGHYGRPTEPVATNCTSVRNYVTYKCVRVGHATVSSPAGNDVVCLPVKQDHSRQGSCVSVVECPTTSGWSWGDPADQDGPLGLITRTGRNGLQPRSASVTQQSTTSRAVGHNGQGGVPDRPITNVKTAPRPRPRRARWSWWSPWVDGSDRTSTVRFRATTAGLESHRGRAGRGLKIQPNDGRAVVSTGTDPSPGIALSAGPRHLAVLPPAATATGANAWHRQDWRCDNELSYSTVPYLAAC